MNNDKIVTVENMISNPNNVRDEVLITKSDNLNRKSVQKTLQSGKNLSYDGIDHGTTFTKIEKDRIRNNIDFNLFNDITFRDVIVYDNDINGRLGLDRCFDNKVGYCVPFGITGVAYYYPPTYNELYFGDVIKLELTDQEQKQPITGSMEFPNLR